MNLPTPTPRNLLLLLLLSAPLHAQVFLNGSHLVNLDDKEYTVTYTEYVLSTRIARIQTPTKDIKNGLVSAYMREEIPGFRIISTKTETTNLIVTAVIAPKTVVPCLAVNLLSLEIAGVGRLEALDNKTVVVKNGKLTVVDTGGYELKR